MLDLLHHETDHDLCRTVLIFCYYGGSDHHLYPHFDHYFDSHAMDLEPDCDVQHQESLERKDGRDEKLEPTNFSFKTTAMLHLTYRSKQKEKENGSFSISELLDNDSSAKPFDVPFIGEENETKDVEIALYLNKDDGDGQTEEDAREVEGKDENMVDRDGESLGLLCRIPGADSCGGREGVASGGSIVAMSNDEENNNNNKVLESCSSHQDDNDGLELGLGLSISGGGLKTKEEGSRILSDKCLSSCSSSSSSSVNISNSSIVGTKRAVVDSVSSPNATSVVGWPPIGKAHQNPTLANRIKPEHNEFSSRPVNNNIINGYLSVKVNIDGILIGRKLDLNAHISYETVAQTLEDMFHGSLGSSRLFNGTSEFLLTYEDKDGDCMLVGDVPWHMFLSSVKRLQILRDTKSNEPNKKS
ncbi:unnamed protein product [Lactuca saligna]|uniref:Auxin-responsive protein n=1 Tax=Lactuca saligna TaxID=75948 RepID=A0AA35V2G7_LACSI|nr:unnamed protein product [Lactuca saligna]